MKLLMSPCVLLLLLLKDETGVRLVREVLNILLIIEGGRRALLSGAEVTGLNFFQEPLRLAALGVQVAAEVAGVVH